MTEDVEKVALAPCPFCGGAPIALDDDSYGYAHVICPDGNNCAVKPSAEASLRDGETLADAVSRWNTRTPPDDSVARIVELEGALRNVLDDSHSYESEGQARDAARAALNPPSRIAHPKP